MPSSLVWCSITASSIVYHILDYYQNLVYMLSSRVYTSDGLAVYVAAQASFFILWDMLHVQYFVHFSYIIFLNQLLNL